MYADDTQLIEYTTASDIPNAIMNSRIVSNQYMSGADPGDCIESGETELIWFGSKASLKKTVPLDLNLYIGADVVKPVGVVRRSRGFLRR